MTTFYDRKDTCPNCEHSFMDHSDEGCLHDWTYMEGIAVGEDGCYCNLRLID